MAARQLRLLLGGAGPAAVHADRPPHRAGQPSAGRQHRRHRPGAGGRHQQGAVLPPLFPRRLDEPARLGTLRGEPAHADGLADRRLEHARGELGAAPLDDRQVQRRGVRRRRQRLGALLAVRPRRPARGGGPGAALPHADRSGARRLRLPAHANRGAARRWRAGERGTGACTSASDRRSDVDELRMAASRRAGAA